MDKIKIIIKKFARMDSYHTNPLPTGAKKLRERDGICRKRGLKMRGRLVNK